VWRKLKRLGALILHDSIWVLPDTSRTREQFQWLAAEISEMEGEAMFWEAQPVSGNQEDVLMKRFIEQVNEVYEDILTRIRKRNPDLAALSQLYQQAKMSDYFQSELGQKVREALSAARGGLD
jgi:hypothetical protein